MSGRQPGLRGELHYGCGDVGSAGSGEVRKLELMSGPWAHYTGDEDPRVVSLEGGRRVGVVFPDRATLVSCCTYCLIQPYLKSHLIRS